MLNTREKSREVPESVFDDVTTLETSVVFTFRLFDNGECKLKLKATTLQAVLILKLNRSKLLVLSVLWLSLDVSVLWLQSFWVCFRLIQRRLIALLSREGFQREWFHLLIWYLLVSSEVLKFIFTRFQCSFRKIHWLNLNRQWWMSLKQFLKSTTLVSSVVNWVYTRFECSQLSLHSFRV
jgi:hypothetical protein